MTDTEQNKLSVGDVVEGLDSELVQISGVREVGNRTIIDGFTVNSREAKSFPLTQEQLARVKIRQQASQGFTYDGDGEAFLLGAEAERISIAHQFDPLFAVSSSIVDPLPHQVEAVYNYLLPLHRIRFLLADDTGAGKTIMAGLLLKELMFRGVIERALIITPGGLTKQWQEDEMLSKFDLPFELIDRSRFSSNPSVFQTANLCITSIDFIRQEDIKETLSSVRWDIVIVDEAHKLSAYEYGSKTDKGARYKVVEEISGKTNHLLLLTATPHRGRKDTFRLLLQLLDPDLFRKDEHVERYLTNKSQDDIHGARNQFFLRRLKEEMVDWDGKPLFQPRHSQTLSYQLTDEELQLYERVTEYVRARKKRAKEQKNRNVELALMVMQRRLASSLYAITATLKNRLNMLKDVHKFVLQNKDRLEWVKKQLDAQIGEINATDIEEFEELDDEQRSDIEKRILRSTLSADPAEIEKEIEEVTELLEFAHSLHGHEESKYVQLRQLLDKEDVIRKEKLVIFTEFTDTLNDLTSRLEDLGYSVVNIHGGMNVDQRKQAQWEFKHKADIMIATDAAGEGINLQFCRFLINWDIPWNPNRLEQRMGRIHRYGQSKSVRVYNLVAENTREGYVLATVLKKMDVMREQLNSDRVYDVIGELFANLQLVDVIHQALDSDVASIEEKLKEFESDETLEAKARELIDTQKSKSLVTKMQFQVARDLKDQSDEQRLQPLYIERYFLKTLEALGGEFSFDEKRRLLRITNVPNSLLQNADRAGSRLVMHRYEDPFVFDKSLLSPLSPVKAPERTRLLGPGHPLFEELLRHSIANAQDSFAQGVTLIDPSRSDPAWLWLVRSRVVDNRSDPQRRVADQRFATVVDNGELQLTSPAYLLNLVPDNDPEQAQAMRSKDDVIGWLFDSLSDPQLEKVKDRRNREVTIRREYLEGAFQDLIADLNEELSELEKQELLGEDTKKQQDELREHIRVLRKRKEERLSELSAMLELRVETPSVVGSARLLPLGDKPEDMPGGITLHRDDEVERIAMETSIKYEEQAGRQPEDVSAENLGYDVRSTAQDGMKRYIEVKGRAQSGEIVLSENELNRLRQLEGRAWLYIVTNCRTNPELQMIQNPGRVLEATPLYRKVQYLIPEKEWRGKVK